MKKKNLLRDSLLTKEYLILKYIEEGLSANQIALNLRHIDTTLTATGVIKYLILYGIPRRTIKDSCNTQDKKNRTVSTNIEKYGAPNPLSRGTDPFIKRNKTVKNKYGVDNVFQEEGVKKKLIKTKIEKGILGKCNPEAISVAFKRRLSDPVWSKNYSEGMSKLAKNTWNNRSEESKKDWIQKIHIGRNVWWHSLTPEDRATFLKKAGFVSKLESSFFDLIEKETNLKIQRQVCIPDSNYSFDGQIENTNILLEVNGTYFHADPRKYCEKDMFRFSDGLVRTAKELWDRDITKQKIALEHGFRLIVFWEYDIKECPDIEIGRIWREYEDYISKENKK